MNHRLAILTALVVSIVGWLALSLISPSVAAPVASMTACPYYVDAMGATATDGVDGIIVGSNTSDSADVRIVLFTHSGSYELRSKIPGFAERYYFNYTMPHSTDVIHSRKDAHLSLPIIFRVPADGPVEAAYVEPLNGGTNSATCSAQRFITSTADVNLQADTEQKRLSSITAGATDTQAPTIREPESPPLCPVPYVQTRVLRAQAPDYPQQAAMMHTTGRAVISILLDEAGAVTAAAVFESSGSIPLDQAAVRAASGSIYSGAIFRCRPAQSVFRFRAEFTAQ